MKKALTMILMMLSISPMMKAQDKLPDTDIWLMEIKTTKDVFSVSDPINITDRPGYDNQPEFLSDGSGILYTSIREDGQADIYEYIINTKATAHITKTSVSEYSPMVVPGVKGFSVVMVEKDSTQRIWEYKFGYTDAHVILPTVDSIGYYCWINKNTMAVFKLTEPPILEIADIKTGHVEPMARNIGRCIQRIPEKNSISFVEKDSLKGWRIMELDLKTSGISSIVNTLPSSEDYVWTPDGVLLMGKDNKLYRFEPNEDTDWEQIWDFSTLGINDFYRMAISPDGSMLAIVSFKNKKP